MFPVNDDEYTELPIQAVQLELSEWTIERSNGLSFSLDCNAVPFPPCVGMMARFYGAGVGSVVRGVFLDGVKVYYRTPEEQAEFNRRLLQDVKLDDADSPQIIE